MNRITHLQQLISRPFQPTSSAKRRSRRLRRPRFTERIRALETLETRNLLATFVVDSLADNTANDEFTTLREAVIMANNTPGADRIAFAPSLAGGTIAITQTNAERRSMYILDDLTIEGPGAEQLTIDAAPIPGRIFFAAEDVSLEVQGLTVANAHSGPAIESRGPLTIADSTFVNNSGRVIYHNLDVAQVDPLTIIRSQFFNNGVGNAYAVVQTGARTTVIDSMFN